MERSERNITWENNPWIIRQVIPWIGIPEYIGELLVKLFGPPILHWWILFQLVRACRKQLMFHYTRTQTHLIKIRVFITEQALKSYVQLDEKILLRELSQWLTEQIQAYLDAEDKSLRWPLVFIECLSATQKPVRSSPNVIFPEKLDDGNFLAFVMSKVAYFLGVKSGVLFDVQSTYPFWFQFSDKYPSLDIYLTVKKPSGENYVHVNQPSFKLGRNSFKGNSLIGKICSLVNPEHVHFSIIKFGINEENIFFAKHLGENETWLVEEGNVQLLPRNGWCQVPSGSLLILGRLVYDHESVKRYIILRGSMIVEIP